MNRIAGRGPGREERRHHARTTEGVDRRGRADDGAGGRRARCGCDRPAVHARRGGPASAPADRDVPARGREAEPDHRDRDREAHHRVQRDRPGHRRAWRVRRPRVEDPVRVRPHRPPRVGGHPSEPAARSDDGRDLLRVEGAPRIGVLVRRSRGHVPRGRVHGEGGVVRREDPGRERHLHPRRARSADDRAPVLAADPRDTKKDPVPLEDLAVAWRTSPRRWPAGRWTSPATR